MKLHGYMTGPQTGEIRWAGGTATLCTVQGGTRGELLANMRARAQEIWNRDAAGVLFDALDGKARPSLDFEIIEEPEPEPAQTSTDPGLVDPARLQARRAAGEHLCFFCTHEPICAIQLPLRAHPAALVVISGCAQFSHVERK